MPLPSRLVVLHALAAPLAMPSASASPRYSGSGDRTPLRRVFDRQPFI
jgi:hypothetical protein